MRGLETLVRLHRWQLDERRRQLADLERLREQLEGEATRLVEELQAEQEVARESEPGRHAYGPYAGQIVVKRRHIASTIAEVDTQLAAARETVAEAFRELKRHETTLAERERRAKVAADRKSQVALDEIGLTMHRRRAPAG